MIQLSTLIRVMRLDCTCVQRRHRCVRSIVRTTLRECFGDRFLGQCLRMSFEERESDRSVQLIAHRAGGTYLSRVKRRVSDRN